MANGFAVRFRFVVCLLGLGVALAGCGPSGGLGDRSPPRWISSPFPAQMAVKGKEMARIGSAEGPATDGRVQVSAQGCAESRGLREEMAAREGPDRPETGKGEPGGSSVRDGTAGCILHYYDRFGDGQKRLDAVSCGFVSELHRP